jgi:transcription initiation factor IIE alpha subunit
MSYCPHCNRVTFEIEEVEVSGVKLKLVQCSGCKSPLGFIENNEVAQFIRDMDQRVTEVLRVVVSSLQKMNSRLDRIEQANEK